MIETRGLPAMIAAADIAAKTADVRVKTYEKADAGIVTVYLVGDVSSVKAAVDAGAAEAKRVGVLLGAHVIPRPDPSVPNMIAALWPDMAESRKARKTEHAEGSSGKSRKSKRGSSRTPAQSDVHDGSEHL
ncbi:BMC domain-containing protein [Paenibacillus sp. MBLB4367]|uniref:BMC domain-containing protein n=1 Tax=Paenibacillus sp. MBLB4367 TaxID=3384767 RepID=UPI0039082478